MCASFALAKIRFSHLEPEIMGDDDPYVIVHEEICLEISHLQIPT